MGTEPQIEIVRKYLQQKVCFGLQQTGHATCQVCRLARECAPLRRARLAYEEQLLQGEGTGDAVNPEFDALMESMSKAKFEEMIARALRRGSGNSLAGPASSAVVEEVPAVDPSIQKSPRRDDGMASVAASQGSKAGAGRCKGRPRTAKEKSGQVLTLAARGLTRQAIARELGISLASVYRILRENR